MSKGMNPFKHNRREFLEDRFNGNINDINAYNRQRHYGYPAMNTHKGLGTSTTTPVVNKGLSPMNFDNSGKYSHVLKEDGTYI